MKSYIVFALFYCITMGKGEISGALRRVRISQIEVIQSQALSLILDREMYDLVKGMFTEWVTALAEENERFLESFTGIQKGGIE